MQDYTIQQIQEKYEQLSPEIREVISSDEILEKIKVVGRKHNLLIDEIGELIDQVTLVMLGLEKSSNFVNDLTKRIAIDEDQAKAIAAEVNTVVFDKIKTKIQEAREIPMRQTVSEKPLTPLERAGNFTIEKDEAPKPSYGYGMTMRPPTVTPPTSSPTATPVQNNVESKREPLVDQLMRASTAIPEERVVKAEPPANLPTSDPYREATK